jgi:hypothetical protein
MLEIGYHLPQKKQALVDEPRRLYQASQDFCAIKRAKVGLESGLMAENPP